MRERGPVGQSPGHLDLRMRTGDDCSWIVEFYDVGGQPVDASGWTLAAEVRETYGGLLLLAFTLDQDGLQSHQWRMSADAADTVDVPEGAWPWDLVRPDGGPSDRGLLAGTVAASPRVTTGAG